MWKEIKLSDIPENKNRRGQIREEIESFLASKAEAAEIDLSNYKTIASAYSTYRTKSKAYNVKIFCLDGRLFMVRGNGNA